jgi:hypothetical protein
MVFAAALAPISAVPGAPDLDPFGGSPEGPVRYRKKGPGKDPLESARVETRRRRNIEKKARRAQRNLELAASRGEAIHVPPEEK